MLLFYTLNAATDVNDTQLKKMIGRMLIVGFNAQEVTQNSQIIKDINRYNLSGVILFDKNYQDMSKTKNISSPKQLQKLTTALQTLSNAHIFIAIDQEGGKVARLKPKYGFTPTPSAAKISQMPLKAVKSIYQTQSQMLHDNGINMNFAPVVDLSINPKNRVIVQLERSYGKNPKVVAKYAEVLINAQNAQNIISVLKHFPGHGSSLGDSHQGFVDISNTWSPKELEPYKLLMNKTDAIMTAHVFNRHLDTTYPATLSYNVNTKLLREKLGFRGVIISDDMQMKAISAHYSLKEATTLAINAGVDILLFGNQLSQNNLHELVQTIFKQVKKKRIKLQTIIDANKRIENLHTKNAIIQKPIIFTQKRIDMTKEYIKKHYGLSVKNITIKPKIIVLHWTAVMDLNESFNRLNAERLFSDRKDIANASPLNVSAHFLVDRDGTIYQLMPDNFMARHVIGLNYSSIGVENVGGKDNKSEDLTPAQLESNIRLVKYLKNKYPSIKYLIGHLEYQKMQSSPLWLEKDANYRTIKADPGKKFMHDVRQGVVSLKLRGSDE